jgi:adenylate cyclase
LLIEAETEAEFTIGWVRIAAGLALFAGGLFASSGIGSLHPDQFAQRSSFVALLSVSAFLALGATSLLLVVRHWFRPWMAFPLVAGDAVILVLALLASLEGRALGGNWIAAMPVAWAAPLVLTVGALRYRSTVQLCITALLTIGFVAVAYGLGFQPAFTSAEAGAPSATTSEAVARLFSLPPYLMRGLILVLIGLTTALVMVRARRLLVRAVSETVHRANLARFLPEEIAPLVSKNGIMALREGRRQQATVMFVDIREFTALAEGMDPARLSVFVSSFRRRVMDAAEAYSAVVDKFIGDGALVVFGFPEPRSDDSARAIACARHLLASVQRWNAKRQFDPPVRVGVGIHSGVVYCGVIGDERRLEFTVLGDVVNVAARIEQATKQFDVPLLASAVVVAEAGQLSGWQEMSHEPLRGRDQHLAVFAPRSSPDPVT